MDFKPERFAYHSFTERDTQFKKILCQELSHIIAARVRDEAINGVIRTGKLEKLAEDIVTGLRQAGHEMYSWNINPDLFETWGYDYMVDNNFGLAVDINILEGSEVSWKSPDGTWVRSDRNARNEIKILNEDDDIDHRKAEKLRWIDKIINLFKLGS